MYTKLLFRLKLMSVYIQKPKQLTAVCSENPTNPSEIIWAKENGQTFLFGLDADESDRQVETR